MMKDLSGALGWTLATILLGVWACNSSGGSQCPAGTESCRCTMESSCDDGLACLSGRCVDTDALTPSGGANTGGNPGSGGGAPTNSGGTSSSPSGGASGSPGAGGSVTPSSGGTSSNGGDGGVAGAPQTTSTGSAGVLNRGGDGGSGPQLPTTTSGSAGSGGINPIPEDAVVGATCESDDDCDLGLICVTADSNSLISGGPAGGLCTQTCLNYCGSDAVCLTFDNDNYCMPLCTPGDGQVDCLGRPDMACDVLAAATGVSCSVDSNCGSGEACLDGTCVFGVPVCLPRCAIDAECPEGRFCDPRTGECVDTEPSGKGVGESCDPDLADDCRGYCVSSRCIEFCSAGNYPACGSSSLVEGTADCLLPVYEGATDLGDVGICFELCDCSSECPSNLSCISFQTPGIDLLDRHGRQGFCDAEVSGDVVLSCSD